MTTPRPRKQRVISPTVREPPPRRWSNCIVVGDVAYVAGMTARGPDGETVVGDDEYQQSRLIFEKIRDVVAAAGGVMDDIVKLTIFVTRVEHKADVWRAREEFFSGDFPACSLVEVSALVKPEMLVEIEAVAHLGCSVTKGV